MNSVARDALENHKRNLLIEANSEIQRHKKKSRESLQEYQQSVPRHLSEVQQELQVQQVARRWEEVDILRHELSQSLAEGSHYQNMYTTSRCGTSESSSSMSKRGSCSWSASHAILHRQKFLEQKIPNTLKSWTGRKKWLPRCKLAAISSGIILRVHTVCARWRISLSRTGVVANARTSAWTCCGRLGTDDTTLPERVDPTTKFTGERDTTSKKKWSFKPGLISETSGSGERISGAEYPCEQVVREIHEEKRRQTQTQTEADSHAKKTTETERSREKQRRTHTDSRPPNGRWPENGKRNWRIGQTSDPKAFGGTGREREWWVSCDVAEVFSLNPSQSHPNRVKPWDPWWIRAAPLLLSLQASAHRAHPYQGSCTERKTLSHGKAGRVDDLRDFQGQRHRRTRLGTQWDFDGRIEGQRTIVHTQWDETLIAMKKEPDEQILEKSY